MKRAQWKQGLVGVLAALLMAGPVFAAEPGPPSDLPDEKGMAAHQQKMAEELGLSKEQSAQLEAFHKEHFAKMKALRTTMQATRKALRDLIDGETFDKAQAANLAGELKQQFSVMVDLRLEDIAKVREILTPEQITKMKAKMEEHRKAREARQAKMKEQLTKKVKDDHGPGPMPGDDIGF